MAPTLWVETQVSAPEDPHPPTQGRCTAAMEKLGRVDWQPVDQYWGASAEPWRYTEGLWVLLRRSVHVIRGRKFLLDFGVTATSKRSSCGRVNT